MATPPSEDARTRVAEPSDARASVNKPVPYLSTSSTRTLEAGRHTTIRAARPRRRADTMIYTHVLPGGEGFKPSGIIAAVDRSTLSRLSIPVRDEAKRAGLCQQHNSVKSTGRPPFDGINIWGEGFAGVMTLLAGSASHRRL